MAGQEGERCWFEEKQEDSGVDFISIKNNQNPSELVFNPELTQEVLGALAWSMTGDEKNMERIIRYICRQCTLCDPDISDSRDLRVQRRDYTFRKSGRLYEQTIVPTNALEKKGKICFAEDTPRFLEQIGKLFVHYGYDVMLMCVNPSAEPTQLGERQLVREIIEWGPDWLVSDKGLGYVDGIQLIAGCKEVGIKTIMLTGERQTDETHRVADIFIAKPVPSTTILQKMAEFVENGLA